MKIKFKWIVGIVKLARIVAVRITVIRFSYSTRKTKITDLSADNLCDLNNHCFK